MTRPREEVDAVQRLSELGLNHCEISRELGIPRGTIRDWLDPHLQEARRQRAALHPTRDCQRCNGTEGSLGPDYVYLLGLYLGDGYLSCSRKGVWQLRIFQDQRYTSLIGECRLAMSAITLSRVSVTQCIGCVAINAWWKHWTHLFPQHGAGAKWLRRIVMEPWQTTLIGRYPAQLIRGLIHSDGCRSMNTVVRRWSERSAIYSYPRYFFSNASDDIRLLFTDACNVLGVRWTRTNERLVAVSRRDDVAFLDTFIGPKC